MVKTDTGTRSDIRPERETPLALHINQIHGGNLECLSFELIKLILSSPMGGGFDRRLLQTESR